jgi:hypothetical protein
MCQFLQHPSARVTFDPPSDPRDPPVLLTDEQHLTLDAQEAIQRLAANLGSYRRLMTLVRNLATLHGQEL